MTDPFRSDLVSRESIAERGEFAMETLNVLKEVLAVSPEPKCASASVGALPGSFAYRISEVGLQLSSSSEPLTTDFPGLLNATAGLTKLFNGITMNFTCYHKKCRHFQICLFTGFTVG